MSHYFTNDYVKSEEKLVKVIVKDIHLKFIVDNGVYGVVTQRVVGERVVPYYLNMTVRMDYGHAFFRTFSEFFGSRTSFIVGPAIDFFPAFLDKVKRRRS